MSTGSYNDKAFEIYTGLGMFTAREDFGNDCLP